MDFATFNLDQLAFKPVKSLDYMKVIDLEPIQGQRVSFITPKLRLSMGIFAVDFSNGAKRKGRTNDLANATRVTIPLSLDLPAYDPSFPAWQRFMDALDVKFKEFILANAQVWIGNPKEASLITRNIDDYYVSPIKPAGDYPAMFGPKINIDGDKNITTTFFDEGNNLIQNPFEQVQPNSLARVRYEVQGLTQHSTTKKFYVNIRAVEAKIYPKPQGPYDDMDVAPRVCSIVD